MKIHTNRTNNGHVQVTFHVATPTGSNTAGVPWTTCVKECPEYPKECEAHQQYDLAAILAGELVEHRETFAFSAADLRDHEKLVELKARYAEVEVMVQAEIKNKLRYYGAQKNP